MTAARTPPLRRRWTDNLVTGLLVLAPAYVTFLLFRVIAGQINVFIGPIIRFLDPWLTTRWATVIVHVGVFILFIAGITVVGWGTRLLVVRRMFSAIEHWFARLPMVGKVYTAVREIAQAFGGEHKTAFTRVVLVEWPGQGRYVIGFVTQEGKGEVQAKTPEHVVNVFVPTTPNPTSGFLILVDRESLIPLDMSVEDGMKLVISGGVVGPPVLPPNLQGR